MARCLLKHRDNFTFTFDLYLYIHASLRIRATPPDIARLGIVRVLLITETSFNHDLEKSLRDKVAETVQ